MSEYITGATSISNEEILSLNKDVNLLTVAEQNLLAKKDIIKAELEENKTNLDAIRVALKIVNQISETHLGTPINVRAEKNYSNGVDYHNISNVTPSKEQWNKERLARYIKRYDGSVKLDLTLCHPEIASSTIICPDEKSAREIAMDFAATGKFPILSKLLCQFKQDEVQKPAAIQNA